MERMYHTLSTVVYGQVNRIITLANPHSHIERSPYPTTGDILNSSVDVSPRNL
jgi:hypothetical protein